MAETFTFQAEIKQLLHTLIHSLYSEREIFLRELISNSSDALHRLQFETLTNQAIVDPDAELGIWINSDEELNTITIRDTGVGMTHDELVANLGTISRSGIKSFMETLGDKKDNQVATDLIGQFGVGFYSVFMVADKVEVTSRSYLPDAEAYRWVCEGGETFYLEPSDKTTRGTDIVIYLHEDAKEFASTHRLRQIVRKHSNYIPFPIYVGEPKTNEEGEVEPLEPANARQAIWRRNPNEVKPEEYNEFYRSLTLDFKEPQLYLHVRSDSPMQFYSLLFVPSEVERPMFSPRQEPGLQLYARKILIKDYSTDLLPEYLQFVQGVVDSEDLPLNVSRETVQANRVMVNLKAAVTNRLLKESKRLAESEPEKYATFWKHFGVFLKHGVLVDHENKDKLIELLRFNSTTQESEYTALDGYLERMVEGQNKIYYVIADSPSAAVRSPHLDPFRERGIEVLYFTDTTDGFLANVLRDYKDVPLQNVDDEDLDLSGVGTSTETPHEAVAEVDLETVLKRFETVLGDRVEGVRVSKVLTGKSPARLVSPEGAMDRHTQRVYKMLNKEFDVPHKILEINSHHQLTHNVVEMIGDNPDNNLIDVVIEQIYENALLLEGLHPNPAEMVDRIQLLLERATTR